MSWMLGCGRAVVSWVVQRCITRLDHVVVACMSGGVAVPAFYHSRLETYCDELKWDLLYHSASQRIVYPSRESILTVCGWEGGMSVMGWNSTRNNLEVIGARAMV